MISALSQPVNRSHLEFKSDGVDRKLQGHERILRTTSALRLLHQKRLHSHNNNYL